MVNVLSGQTEITIGDDKYTVHAGESIVMPANVPHALYATEAFQMLLVVVKPNP
ncbi:Cupin domain protein [compost metagenome]